MNEIRKDYKNFKLLNEQTNQEAKTWVIHNVILLNEKFDRSTLHRLNSSIQRFDQKFGPYRSKLPALSKVLNDAEKGLYVVITGGASKKSAGHMLERMTLIYNILSNFFGRDLGALLKTPVFRTAVAMPERALNQIEHPEHNPKMIKKVFLAALKPDRIEREVFDRAYKNIPMPSLNWSEASNQLMGLCVNDLNELCGIEKVPAIIVDTENTENTEDLQENLSRIEERPEFALLQSAIGNIYNFVRDHNFSSSFINNVNRLSDELVDLINNQGLASRTYSYLTSLGGTITSQDPAARLLVQCTRVVQIFTTIKATWKANKDMFMGRVRNTGQIQPRDVDAIKSLITRALEKGGQIPSGLSKFTGMLTRISNPSGLDPNTIITEYYEHVIKKDLENNIYHIIKFDRNGAEGEPPPSERVNINDSRDKIRLPNQASLTRRGYTFEGWSTSSRGTPVLSVGDEYRPNASTTLYAVWSRPTP